MRIVLTGGPSAGKTTLLSLLSRRYSGRVGVASEAATIHFSQGNTRPQTLDERVQTQRQIFQLQRHLEREARERVPSGPLFCDRGSLDGVAYWPGTLKEFCFAMGTSLERELTRYTAILHLQSAAIGTGYKTTAIRNETPAEAIELDRRIAETWKQHPNYFFVENEGNFLSKLERALSHLAPFLPEEASTRETVSDLIATC